METEQTNKKANRIEKTNFSNLPYSNPSFPNPVCGSYIDFFIEKLNGYDVKQGASITNIPEVESMRRISHDISTALLAPGFEDKGFTQNIDEKNLSYLIIRTK